MLASCNTSFLFFSYTVPAAANLIEKHFFLFCIFIEFNLYIPHCVVHILSFVMGAIYMHDISTGRCNNSQTQGLCPWEPTSGWLINSHRLLLKSHLYLLVSDHYLVILISCFCFSNINLVTLWSLLFPRRAVILSQFFIACFGCVECKVHFSEPARKIFCR